MKHLLLVAAAALLSPLLIGCHNQNTDLSESTPIPSAQVMALTTKPAGDTGQELVRQEPEDQPTITPSSGPQTPSPDPLTRWTAVDTLALGGSTPGLLVCEPVGANAPPALADFGSGCGRWLHFSVAGLPQMGQTPLWSSLERAQTELGRANLRLTLPEAERCGGILGIRTAALGTITGSATHCTLTYQLYALPGGASVGAPLQATGTEAQVLSQLPALAGQMAASLGVSPASSLAAVAAAPAQMELLGRLSWYPNSSVPAAQIQQLKAMAPRLPLAGLFLVNASAGLTDSQWTAAAKTLLRQEPSNGLVWAQVSFSAPSLMASAQSQMALNVHTYPKNYLFASANTWIQRRLRRDNSERRSAEQTVQNAPRNPDAWLTLGSTVSEEGSRLRQSRTASAISQQDWQFLRSSYSQWQYAVTQATQLDPLCAKAWTRLASAATFAGHSRLADQALWKGIALDTMDPDAYAWGLQMYQSKWGGSSQKLQHLAQTMATLAYPKLYNGVYALKMLGDNEGNPNQFRAQKQTLLAALLARTQAQIAANPGDAQAHYDQAYLLSLAGHKREATTEYQNVTMLRPRDARAYLDLAQEYDQRNMITPAISAFQQSVHLDVTSAAAHYGLGWDLKVRKQMPRAEAQMRQAIKLAPQFAEAHAGLAQVLGEQGRKKEALPELQQAVQLNPFLMPAVPELCTALDEDGRYQESLSMGRHAVQINPNDNNSMDTMADDYLHLKNWDRSLQMSNLALQINPDDMLAHENLAEAYLGAGRKAEAHDEWNKVLAGHDSRMATVARQMLAKYP